MDARNVNCNSFRKYDISMMPKKLSFSDIAFSFLLCSISFVIGLSIDIEDKMLFFADFGDGDASDIRSDSQSMRFSVKLIFAIINEA